MAGLSNIGIPSFKNEYGGQERYRPPRTLSTLRFDTAAFKSVIVRFIGKRKGGPPPDIRRVKEYIDKAAAYRE